MQFGAGSVQINAGKFRPDFIYLIEKRKNDEFSAASSVFVEMRFEGQPTSCLQSLAKCRWALFCAVLRQPQS
jgi:hypothetical protein